MDCVNSKGHCFWRQQSIFLFIFLVEKYSYKYVPIITADNLDTDARGALLHEENSKLDFKEE